MAGATAGAADLAAYRQRLWSAIAAESAKALEGGLLEVVVAELQAGRSAGFRRVLLQALDGSSVAQNSRTSDLLQRFAEDARGGSAEAAVLLGALLCFHAMFNSEEMQDLAGQGFKYLEAVAMRGNKLGLLLYGLAAEAGRGTPRDHLRAHQAYHCASEAGDVLADTLMKELQRDMADAEGALLRQQQQQQQGAQHERPQAEGGAAVSPGASKEPPCQRTSPAMMPSSPPQSASAQQRGLHRSHSGSSSGGSGGGHANGNGAPAGNGTSDGTGGAERAAADGAAPGAGDKAAAAMMGPGDVVAAPADTPTDAPANAPAGAAPLACASAPSPVRLGSLVSPFEAADTRHLIKNGAAGAAASGQSLPVSEPGLIAGASAGQPVAATHRLLQGPDQDDAAADGAPAHASHAAPGLLPVPLPTSAPPEELAASEASAAAPAGLGAPLAAGEAANPPMAGGTAAQEPSASAAVAARAAQGGGSAADGAQPGGQPSAAAGPDGGAAQPAAAGDAAELCRTLAAGAPAAAPVGAEEASARGVHLLAHLASVAGVAPPADAPGGSNPQMQQAYEVTVSGLDPVSRSDFLHNLGVLCSEAPRNDMVILPSVLPSAPPPPPPPPPPPALNPALAGHLQAQQQQQRGNLEALLGGLELSAMQQRLGQYPGAMGRPGGALGGGGALGLLSRPGAAAGGQQPPLQMRGAGGLQAPPQPYGSSYGQAVGGGLGGGLGGELLQGGGGFTGGMGQLGLGLAPGSAGMGFRSGAPAGYGGLQRGHYLAGGAGGGPNGHAHGLGAQGLGAPAPLRPLLAGRGSRFKAPAGGGSAQYKLGPALGALGPGAAGLPQPGYGAPPNFGPGAYDARFAGGAPAPAPPALRRGPPPAPPRAGPGFLSGQGLPQPYQQPSPYLQQQAFRDAAALGGGYGGAGAAEQWRGVGGIAPPAPPARGPLPPGAAGARAGAHMYPTPGQGFMSGLLGTGGQGQGLGDQGYGAPGAGMQGFGALPPQAGGAVGAFSHAAFGAAYGGPKPPAPPAPGGLLPQPPAAAFGSGLSPAQRGFLGNQAGGGGLFGAPSPGPPGSEAGLAPLSHAPLSLGAGLGAGANAGFALGPQAPPGAYGLPPAGLQGPGAPNSAALGGPGFGQGLSQGLGQGLGQGRGQGQGQMQGFAPPGGMTQPGSELMSRTSLDAPGWPAAPKAPSAAPGAQRAGSGLFGASAEGAFGQRPGADAYLAGQTFGAPAGQAPARPAASEPSQGFPAALPGAGSLFGGLREPLGSAPLPGLPAAAGGHRSADGSQQRAAGGSLHSSASFSLFRAPSPRGGAAPGPAGLAPERADSAPGWSLVPSSSEAPGGQSQAPSAGDPPAPPVAFGMGAFAGGGGFGAIGAKLAPRAPAAESMGGSAPSSFNAAPGRNM